MSLFARLDIPDPELRLGPDPSVNEWNMGVVGVPIWFWASEPGTRQVVVDQAGYEFRLTARRSQVVVSAGDGSAAITCKGVTPYPGESGLGQSSPTCGHTYSKPSASGQPYKIVARAQWVVDWSALDYSGSVPLQVTTSRTIKVGELQSVIVRAG